MEQTHDTTECGEIKFLFFSAGRREVLKGTHDTIDVGAGRKKQRYWKDDPDVWADACKSFPSSLLHFPRQRKRED